MGTQTDGRRQVSGAKSGNPAIAGRRGIRTVDGCGACARCSSGSTSRCRSSTGGWCRTSTSTTPPARRRSSRSIETIDRFLPYYSGVHRGTGYKSRVSTAAFESARAVVGEFVGADPDRDVVVFTKNTTEAINKLARSLPIGDGEIVLTTFLEHHSNDLPWRSTARCVHVRVVRRRDTRRGPPRPAARPVPRPRRPARCLRRIQRHRRRAADPPTGPQGPRSRREDPRRRCPARRPPADRHATPRRPQPTWTSSPCRRTRPMPRSAAARSSARGTPSRQRPTIAAAARSTR